MNRDYEHNNTIHQLFLDLTLHNANESLILEQTIALLQRDIHYVNLLNRDTFPSDYTVNQLKSITEPSIHLLPQKTYVYPVKNEHQIFGFLLFETEHPIEADDKRILENASISLALLTIQFQVKSQTSFKERFELFQHILAGQALY